MIMHSFMKNFFVTKYGGKLYNCMSTGHIKYCVLLWWNKLTPSKASPKCIFLFSRTKEGSTSDSTYSHVRLSTTQFIIVLFVFKKLWWNISNFDIAGDRHSFRSLGMTGNHQIS
jgi:hypothetical protein